MKSSYSNLTIRYVLLLMALTSLLLVSGCGDTNSVPSQGLEQKSVKQASVTRPVQTPFFPSYSTSAGSGVHAGHSGFGCNVCHLVGGAVQFDPKGPAILSGTLRTDSNGVVIVKSNGTVDKSNVLIASQLPSYNPSNGTCSNIACHVVKPGTYTYYDNAAGQLTTVPYGSLTPKPSPDWYSTGVTQCTACHGYPPYDSPNQYTWHSSNHGGVNINTNPGGPLYYNLNNCDLCHPDVKSIITGTLGTPSAQIITTIIKPQYHAQGKLDSNNLNYDNSPIPCSYCHGF